MGRLEVFATIPINSNLQGGVHSVSTGREFCIATCHDQVGNVDLNWFATVGDESQTANTVNSTGSNQTVE